MASPVRRNARAAPMQVLSLGMPRTGTVSTSSLRPAQCHSKAKSAQDLFSMSKAWNGILSLTDWQQQCKSRWKLLVASPPTTGTHRSTISTSVPNGSAPSRQNITTTDHRLLEMTGMICWVITGPWRTHPPSASRKSSSKLTQKQKSCLWNET